VDNHVYRVFHRRASWAEAKAACERDGAHLVTITSPEEGAFLVSRIFVEFWLGAGDHQEERHFRWVTGEEFRHQEFAPGEPDDPNGQHDCLFLGRDRRWHDRPCEPKQAYVCETD
jgi:C-type mannose receptor